jgi:hypothetical protein
MDCKKKKRKTLMFEVQTGVIKNERKCRRIHLNFLLSLCTPFQAGLCGNYGNQILIVIPITGMHTTTNIIRRCLKLHH